MSESAPFEPGHATRSDTDLGKLKARVQLLEQENERLTSQAEDMLLLGVIHEAISPLSDCQQILAKGLERMVLLKDIPLCCGGAIEHGVLHVVSSAKSFSGHSPDGCRIALNNIIGGLDEPRYLHASACRQLDLPVPDGFCANEILLLPFHCRYLPDGLLLFACDSEAGSRLDASAALLGRIVDAMALKMDNAMVMDVLKDINAKLDQRVEERSKALYESEAQYRSLIDQAMDSIFVFDAENGRFLDVNAAACRGLGYSKEELLALGVTDILDAQSADFLPHIRARLEAEGTIVHEGRHRHRDGSIFHVETHLGMILLNGEIRVLAISHDTTEQQRAEAQLLQAQKMEGIGTLVGGIAHDFNNMLAGMMGNLYLIGHDASLSSDAHAKVGRINELCERATNMIAQLLTFARKGMVRMEPVAFRLFLEEALKLVELGIPENIQVSHAFDVSEAATVMGDEVQLQQLVLNLLVNARDAVKAVSEPRINVSLKRIGTHARLQKKHQGLAEGPWLELCVEDNGCGIPESIRDQLFEPFFTTKEVGEGTGLGLSTVYGVVQSHQGAIQIDSHEHQGATFRVYLPLHGEQSVEAGNDSGTIPKGHGETILLVDDEEIVLTTTSALLSHLGYRVITAHNGFDALEKEDLETIDIALLDVVMPEMGGVETARRLRGMNPKLPIIFATAYDRNLVLSKQDRLPNSWILSKPFRLQLLATVLQESLR